MARTSVEKRLERAKEAKARAEAQIRQAAAKLRAEDRKQDARRKIVLGGAVIGQPQRPSMGQGAADGDCLDAREGPGTVRGVDTSKARDGFERATRLICSVLIGRALSPHGQKEHSMSDLEIAVFP